MGKGKTKRCNKCNKVFPLDKKYFYPADPDYRCKNGWRHGCKDGFRPVCKKCQQPASQEVCKVCTIFKELDIKK